MPTIYIPTPSAGAVEAGDETEIDLFGVDLLFTDDIQVTASGDYATIEGYDALKQAIKIRLMTSPGEYAIHPEFGCGLSRWVKKRATQSDRDTLRQTIIDQLSQEERIANVEEVTVESFTSDGATGVKVFVRVTALGRENSFAFTSFAE